MSDAEITIKARRFDPRDEETVDLKHFDLIEIRRGQRRFVVRVEGERLIVSAGDRLTIQPIDSNWIEILL
jgi:hypothetical protein